MAWPANCRWLRRFPSLDNLMNFFMKNGVPLALLVANWYFLRPRRVTWIKTKKEGVKSGCSSAHKPGTLGLSCKTNKCSEAVTGDLGVQPTHETSPTRPGWMPPQVRIVVSLLAAAREFAERIKAELKIMPNSQFGMVSHSSSSDRASWEFRRPPIDELHLRDQRRVWWADYLGSWIWLLVAIFCSLR